MPDLGSNSHTVVVNVQGVPEEGVVDTGADITIVGGSVFKQVAAVAKLRKKSFKPPDRTPRTYDRKPFRLDGRLDLDVSFGDKTLNTPVYVKMDASEPLLLSEGVCRQLGIVSYHPDVHPKNAKPETPNVAEATTIATVPSVCIKLVTSVRLPPNEAVAAEVQLEGIEENYRGPWLLQSNDTVVEDLGVCVIDCLVTPTADPTTKVVLTNRLGISQKAEAGMIVGNALPAELIEPNSSCLSPVSSDGRFDDSCEALSLAEVRDISSDDSRAEWRKKKLGELLIGELKNPLLSEEERRQLRLLLEEYHEVFSLEGERGETDLVELDVETGSSPPRAQPVRRIPFAVRREVARQLREMQDSGVVRRSNSPKGRFSAFLHRLS